MDDVLEPTTLTARAQRVRIMLTDVDGVLTDGSVYYSARGEELLRFSRRDGMGVERLRSAGIETAIITREKSEIVRRRAEKLGVERIFEGVRDKRAALDTVLADCHVHIGELGYIGDDVNDAGIIDILRTHNLIACPADAMPEISRMAHYVCRARGGEGAFREFAEWVLSHRNSNM